MDLVGAVSRMKPGFFCWEVKVGMRAGVRSSLILIRLGGRHIVPSRAPKISIKHEDYVKSKTKHEKFKPIPFHDTKEVCPRGRGDASK